MRTTDIPLDALEFEEKAGQPANANAGTAGPDSERSQAIVRLVFGLVISLYMAGVGAFTGFDWSLVLTPICVTMGGVAIAAGIYAHIKIHPEQIPARLILAIFVDIVSLTLFLYFGKQLTAPFLFVYLWVTLANGFRFGLRYLFIAQALSVTCYFGLIQFSDYWGAQPAIEYGLLAALAAAADLRRQADPDAAFGQGPGRGGEPGQVALPGDHEPRAAHAAQLDHRPVRPARRRQARPRAALDGAFGQERRPHACCR